MATYSSGSTSLRIDEHLPADGKRHSALVLLHGSGGNIGFWLDRLAPALASFGVALFGPHYFEKTGTTRATPELILDGRHVPAWISAAEDAIIHVAAHAAVDPARVAVLGVSLGGYLAMALAARSAPDRRLKAVIELSGGLPPGFENHLSAATPPVLILHGAADTTVPVSEAHKLDRLLTERGVPHQTEIFPNETHWFSQSAQLKLLLTCGAFLRRHL